MTLAFPAMSSGSGLTGEEVFGQDTFQAQPDSTCNADGTGTLHFTATGAATGPYAGPFSQEGTVQFGPRPGPGELNTVIAFNAQFQITTPTESVTGSQNLGNRVPPELGFPDFVNKGECTQVYGFGTNYFQVGASYQATVHDTTTGSDTADSGESYLSGASARTISPSNFIYGSFLSLTVPDHDGDGIYNTVDTYPATPTDEFNDYAKVHGLITDRAGLPVTIEDAADPSDGVKVSVGGTSGQVTLDTCGGTTVTMDAGTVALLKCGSVILNVIQGEATVVLAGGSVTVPAGSSAEVADNADGTFTVSNLGSSGDVTYTVDGVQATVGPGATSEVGQGQDWDFQGFTAPVDNPSTVNLVKAGLAVPLKWRLLSPDGTPATGIANATLTVSTRSCALGTSPDLLEEAASGASGLQNLGDGYFQLNWKTPKTYAGSCKTLHLDLGAGITREAYFNFTK